MSFANRGSVSACLPVGIPVPDKEKAVKFYVETFGFERVSQSWIATRLSDGVMNITLLQFETDDYPLALTFFRLVQFCDDQYRNIPRLRRQAREPFLDIHPTTASTMNIQNGDWVALETATGKVRLRAKFNSFLHPSVVATQYGWWSDCKELDLPGYDPLTPDGANANLVIPNDVVDPISGSVPHRSQRCRVRKER